MHELFIHLYIKSAWFLLNIALPHVYFVYSEVGELLLGIGIGEINLAVNQISDLSARNKQNTHKLQPEINKFKT